MSKPNFSQSRAIAHRWSMRLRCCADSLLRSSTSQPMRRASRLRRFRPVYPRHFCNVVPMLLKSSNALRQHPHGLESRRLRFFPTIKLTGAAGLETLDLGTFVNWESRAWSVGPSVHVPIFEGGRNRANLKAAEARYEQSVAG